MTPADNITIMVLMKIVSPLTRVAPKIRKSQQSTLS